ncbi:hypothetical protein KHA80_00885 [Anaerobacillus sp. HL2]|nr:hypothetical protein KHA80_00885 [Anaerobacillus sp. HL2]
MSELTRMPIVVFKEQEKVLTLTQIRKMIKVLCELSTLMGYEMNYNSSEEI